MTKRSRTTPGGGAPERPTPKPRKSRRTPVSSTPVSTTVATEGAAPDVATPTAAAPASDETGSPTPPDRAPIEAAPATATIEEPPAKTEAADPRVEAKPTDETGAPTPIEPSRLETASAATVADDTAVAAAAKPLLEATKPDAIEANAEPADARDAKPDAGDEPVVEDTRDAKPQPIYDDPFQAVMPAPEAVGDIANIPLPPSASGQMSAQGLPDPAQAAFEAARIAEQVLGGNIETASGAAIVAAAAAGAAIEAARMRALAGEQTGVETPPAAPPPPTAQETPPSDPVTTVRMQRERVLRALAADVAANAQTTVAAEQQAVEARLKTPSQPPLGRAPSQQGFDEDPGELDPVAIAAAAIQRLRHRASTDFAELRGHYQRHDIVVLVLAFIIIVIAGRVHARLVTPPTKEFAVRGLTFLHSTTWLEPEEVPPYPPRIIRDPTGLPPKRGTAYHVQYTNSLDPTARLEVFIDRKPAWSNIVTGLELDRRTRYGELYTLDGSSVRSVEDQDWLRTEYRYAYVAEQGDEPRIDRAVEYATIDREQIYVVTMFGSPAQLDRIEDVIVPTLRVPTRSGLPLVAQTRSLGQRTYPNPVSRAFDSTVMVVVGDLVDGRLKARGGGSGVIVGADGSVLTNYHVIHDKEGRLHDVFVIGRFSALDRAPQLQCAGRPSRSKLQRDLDLALIKCDLDLDGRTWQPAQGQIWPTLPEARSAEIKMGQRVWVLGYPDAGGGGLRLNEGAVEGWTGQDGTQGRDFIKTDASITHGNSGGPVVDDAGRLIGIAAASRTKVTATGAVVEVAQVGLVRPLPTASDLLAIAAAGWTPREGHTEVEIQPSAVEAPSEGVRIGTKVIDAANEAPVRDALVLVLRPGVKTSGIDVNRLDDQTLAWGRSNTQGLVHLRQPVPVPGTYTVMVIARGYEPLIGEGALKLDDKTPPAWNPWGEIKLLSR